jgi:hypothetical protein
MFIAIAIAIAIIITQTLAISTLIRKEREREEEEESQLQKRPHRLSLSRLSKIAVMVKSLVYLIIRDSQAHKFSK